MPGPSDSDKELARTAMTTSYVFAAAHCFGQHMDQHVDQAQEAAFKEHMDQLFRTTRITPSTGPGSCKFDLFMLEEQVAAAAARSSLDVAAAGRDRPRRRWLHVGSVQTHCTMREVWAKLNAAFPDIAWRVTFAFE